MIIIPQSRALINHYIWHFSGQLYTILRLPACLCDCVKKSSRLNDRSFDLYIRTRLQIIR